MPVTTLFEPPPVPIPVGVSVRFVGESNGVSGGVLVVVAESAAGLVQARNAVDDLGDAIKAAALA